MQKYWKTLLKLIQEGKLDPAMVITHRMPLDEAARGYKIFNDKHEEDGTLVQKVGALAPDNYRLRSLVRLCISLLGSSTHIAMTHKC